MECLVAWTVNDPSELRTLFRPGAQGNLTDRPAVLRRIVGRLVGPPSGGG